MRKRLLAAAALLLVVAGAAAQVAAGNVEPEGIASKARAKREALMLAAELALLRAKVINLELSLAVKAQALKSKDGGIDKQGARMSRDIATLQSEIAFLQSKGSVDTGEQKDEADAWAIEFENEIEKFKKDMEARASDAKKMVQEHNAMMEELQKMDAEQEKILHDLKVAEEELMWMQSVITTIYEQVGEKWISVIKEKWAIAKTNTEPYVQMVSEKSVEVYEASRDAISPHVLKAHEFADPYFQDAKKLSKPYVDQVAKASKPNFEKLKTTLKPYTKEAGHAYEKILCLVQRARREPREGVPPGAAGGHANGHEHPAPST